MTNNDTHNKKLAQELVTRLNSLIQNPEICTDVSNLMKLSVSVSPTTADHPTIQVTSDFRLRFLGLLNGICGTLPQESFYSGWGYIAAVTDENTGELRKFTLLE